MASVSTRKKLTPRDLFSVKLIESPQISPNGQEVVFVHKTFDVEKNDYNSKLRLINLGTHPAGPRDVSLELTQGPHDSHPQFSADGGQIAFLRKLGEVEQLFVLSETGRKAKQVTHFKNSVSDFAWSPDGKKIVFTARVTEHGLVSEKQKPDGDPYKKYNDDVKVVRRIWYKSDGDGFLHDKRSQIFTIDLKTKKIKQLTFGEHEAQHPQFSPDGSWIVFASNRDPDSDYELKSYIYVIPVDGGEPRNLTPGNYVFTNPIYSPDGKWIAFTGYDEPENWYANVRLWVIPAKGGKPECLTPESDFCVGDQSLNDFHAFAHTETPAWSDDSRHVYVSVSERGQVHLIEVDVTTRAVKKLGGGKHSVNAWSCRGDRAVVSLSDPVTPNDLWMLHLSSGKLDRLTDINAKFSRTFALVKPENFVAASRDGTKIDSWILKPPDFREGKQYPAVLEIHGGPMAMYSWSCFYEFQLLAHQGYCVIYSNPRGSFGYGQPFCEAIKGDWGNLDYQDVMAVLDAAIKKGFIDEKRLGVAGGSYGGFMTNWIIGHTDRFKAAVTMRSVTNEASMFGTSDYGFVAEQNMGCLPWENPEAYRKMSPLTYVEKIKTPLLILHSENDLRCPMEQAEQLFVALKKLKRDVLFVRFPGETHELSRSGKPWHRVFRLDQIVSWFKKYV